MSTADSRQQTADGSGAEKTEEIQRSEYTGGRFEPVDGAIPTVVDDQSAYDAALPVVPVGVVSTSAPVEITLTNVAETAPIELPPDVPEDAGIAQEDLGDVLDASEAADQEAIAPTLRLLGSEIGPEFEGHVPEIGEEDEPLDFGSTLIQLVDAALEEGEAFDGQRLAQIFCRGDVEDDRIAFLLLLLAQNRPVTGELVLLAAREQGHGELVDHATIAREELGAAADVAVEQATALGGFVPLSDSLGSSGRGLEASP